MGRIYVGLNAEFSRSSRGVCLTALLLVLGQAPQAGAATAPPPPRRGDIQRLLSLGPMDKPAEFGQRPLTIVLLADRKDHGTNEHDYPRWQSRWALLLGGASASTEKAANLFGPDLPDSSLPHGASNVRILTAQSWPEPAQWEAAHLVIAYCYLQWNPQRMEQVCQYLKRGGGLVVIHSATWTKPKASPEVASILGVGGFQKYRHGPLTLELTSPEHPICAGLPSLIRLEDESYWPPTPPLAPERVKVLAGCREKNSPDDSTVSLQPMFWTYETGRGRVFGCVPGHYSWTFDDPYFRILLLRGMAWAARENVHRFDPVVLRSARVAAE